MKILKAIGGFFAKIWRWIKETAWVQPLLIVGGIFALIFSIPYFTKWVQSWGIGKEDYYSNKKKSLEGEKAGGDLTSDSAADRITQSIFDNSNFDGTSTEYTEDFDKYGTKFFLVYVKEDCSGCDKLQNALKTLEEGWGTSYVPTEITINNKKVSSPFKVHTIFTDETSSNDDKYEETAFQRHLQTKTEFFEEAGGRFSDQTPYRRNANLSSSSDYDYFTTADEKNFATPTIILVDYSDQAKQLKRVGAPSIVGRQGASEILFGVEGVTKYEQAKLLLDMWNHTENDSRNRFSEAYR